MNIKVNQGKRVGNLSSGNIVQKVQGSDEYFILSNHFRKVDDVQEILVVNLATGEAKWFDMDRVVYPVKGVELVVGGEQ